MTELEETQRLSISPNTALWVSGCTTGFTQKGCIEQMGVFISFFLLSNSYNLKDSSIPTASHVLVKCHVSYLYTFRK